MELFCSRRAVVTVFVSNKLEHTLPRGVSEQETCKILVQLLETLKSASNLQKEDLFANKTRDAEGENKEDGDKNKESIRQQFQQHLRALVFLDKFKDKELSVELICSVHEILMSGSVDDDKRPILNGQFRTGPCMADNYSFPEHSTIPESLQKIVNDFNNHFKNKTKTVFELSAWLFERLVSLHPFENGNGRLCRLLASHVFRMCGVPFFVPVTSGHSNARRHYYEAIKAQQSQNRGMGLLNFLMFTSLHVSWSNFNNNLSLL